MKLFFIPNRMDTRTLTKIAILAGIQSVTFTMFSQILYLEGITFVICLFACVFKKREVILASFTFGMVNMLIQGVTIWTMMYILIYPIYSGIVATFRSSLLKNRIVLVGLCGFFSFLTGQFLELPFLLFSKEVTVFYLVLGLKTSIIQGCLSALLCLLLFDPCFAVLEKIERRFR